MPSLSFNLLRIVESFIHHIISIWMIIKTIWRIESFIEPLPGDSERDILELKLAAGWPIVVFIFIIGEIK